jgi:hypothetical protein
MRKEERINVVTRVRSIVGFKLDIGGIIIDWESNRDINCIHGIMKFQGLLR